MSGGHPTKPPIAPNYQQEHHIHYIIVQISQGPAVALMKIFIYSGIGPT